MFLLKNGLINDATSLVGNEIKLMVFELQFFVWIRVPRGLTLPLKSQEPGFSTFPCPFHVCKHFSNLEDPPKNCNYQMKLFMVVYMCLLDLTFETCDLSQVSRSWHQKSNSPIFEFKVLQNVSKIKKTRLKMYFKVINKN